LTPSVKATAQIDPNAAEVEVDDTGEMIVGDEAEILIEALHDEIQDRHRKSLFLKEGG
jgi:biopolymer transport protein ExbD